MKKQLLILLLLTGMFSCAHEDCAPLDPDVIASLTAAKYKLWLLEKPYIVKTYYFNDQPANSQFLPCQLDNVLYFKPNGVFYELEGALRCDPAKDTADRGTWSVSATQLYLNTTNIPNTRFNIIYFNRNNFRVLSDTDYFPGTKLGAYLEAQ